ncbi:MAG TPA: phage/plasmid primase, P4 family, partial [Pyrinomonadaceae bacterium]|nr:phage/plasmid primase, P4 family [Pyrinomonadaceae bacterium]
TRAVTASHCTPLKFDRGSRNSSLASLAGTLLQTGVPPDALEGMLLEANSTICSPPLQEREVRTIAASISRYPVRNGFTLSDLGNAQRFAELYHHDLIYVPELNRWLRWVGTHWRTVDGTEILRCAFVVPNLIKAEALALQNENQKLAKELVEHSRRSEGRQRLEAMIKLAQPLLAIDANLLDSDPMLLPAANGTVDLRTGFLREPQRSDYLTRCVDVEFDPNVQAPRWQTFLNEITNGDKELEEFLQRAVGYMLTGDTREQCLFVFYGHGANGKSTFVEVVGALLGDYALKTPMTTFVQPKMERSSNDLARMRGARVVAASEIGPDAALNVSLIKELTGQDTITSRFLYGEFFQYRPQFKVVLTVNELPEICGGCDEAIRRRLCVVPFTATFMNETRDNTLAPKLMIELSGILAWAVQGNLRWQANGLQRPESVARATNAYLSQIDALGEFLGSATRPEKEARIPVRKFTDTFNRWLDAAGHEAISPKAIGGLMRKKGYTSAPSGGVRFYAGLTFVGSVGAV